MKKLIVAIISGLIILGSAGMAIAATEFVCAIRSDGTGDYSTLNSWNTLLTQNGPLDLTAGATKVFSHSGISGDIPDGSSVICNASGATAIAVHATSAGNSSQILLKNIVGEFFAGDQVTAPGDSNFVVLSDNGDSAIAVARIEGQWVSAETSPLDINGWVTSHVNYVSIYTVSTAHHQGKWSDTAYRICADAAASNAYTIRIQENNVRIKGLQAQLTNAGSYIGCSAISIDNQSASADIRVEQCLLKGVISGSNSQGVGIYANSANVTGRFYNNLIYNFMNGASPCSGIEIGFSGGTYYLYNNTIVDCFQGIKISAGTAIAKNNLVKGSGANTYIGTFAAGTDYNATDSSDSIGVGTNNRTIQTFTFADEASDDFHLASADSGAKNFGTDLSSDFTDDIEGDIARASTWDIGCSEYAKVWISGTYWSSANNWSPAGVPQPSDIVIFNSRSLTNCTLDVSPTVGAFINTGGYTGTVSTGGNNLTVNGNFQWAGPPANFITAASTVILNATLPGRTLFSGGINFSNLHFNLGASATGDWTIKDDFTVTHDLTLGKGVLNTSQVGRIITITRNLIVAGGTLSGGADITVSGGNVTGDGVINLTGGTFSLLGSGSFGGSTDWAFYNLTFGNGASTTTTSKAGSSNINVLGELKVSPSHTLNAGPNTWNLSWAKSANVLSDVSQISVAATGLHCLALKKDGTVWAWGLNLYGELGDGTRITRTTPVQVKDPSGTGYLSGITAVSAGSGTTAWGSEFSLALKNDGTVYAWGWGAQGEMGNGDTAYVHCLPQAVPSLSNIKAISAGYHFCLALKNDGTVWAWGENIGGQLGDGTTADRSTPVQVQGGALNGVIAISAGSGSSNSNSTTHINNTFSLALRNDGTIYAWGGNANGQLGNGTTTDSLIPVQVQGVGGVGTLSGITAISAGSHYSLFLRDDGTVYSCGRNNEGQLGLGSADTDPHSTPVLVTGSLSGITAISAGSAHGIALKDNGIVYAWGNNGSGRLGDGTTTTRSSPVRVIETAIPLKYLSGITAISAGGYTSLALKGDDSTIWAWGGNGYGQLGNGGADPQAASLPTVVLAAVETINDIEVGLGGFTKIVAGNSHMLALKSDGTVWAWGRNTYGQLGNNDSTQGSNFSRTFIQVKDSTGNGFLTGITDIAASGTTSLAVMNNDTVWAWGRNGLYGLLGNGSVSQWGVNPRPSQVRTSSSPLTYLMGVSKVAISSEHCLALKTDGTVWAWGSNSYGQLGDGVTSDYRTVAIPATSLNGIGVVTAIAAGGNYSLALMADGSLYAWGLNNYGQLGNGTETNSITPVQIPTLSGVTAIAASDSHNLAVVDNDTLWSWGINDIGQLGDNSTTDRSSPVRVGTLATGYLSGITAISAASNSLDMDSTNNGFSLALKNDGTVWAWGLNNYGQLGDDTTTNERIPVQVKGAGGVGMLSDVSAVSAGGSSNDGFSLALKSDGTLLAWGGNSIGGLPDNKLTPVVLTAPAHQSFIIGAAAAFMPEESSSVRYSGNYNDGFSNGYIAVAGIPYYNFEIDDSSGTFVLTGPVSTEKDLKINSGSLDAGSGSYPINCAGDWINNAGTFIPRNNTVTLTGATGAQQTISGDNTFYNLTKAAAGACTLFFEATKTQAVKNALTLTSTSPFLFLRSTVPGTQWKIDPPGTRNISFVDVQDSHNVNSSQISPLNSKNADSNPNNIGWAFTSVANVSSSSLDGSYNAGKVIDITVTFPVPVVVTGIPQMALATGTGRVVDYSSGSGTNTLVFHYTVWPGENSVGELDYVDTNSLTLNGGTIKDTEGNDAMLALATPGSVNSLSFNRDIIIDTTPPAAPPTPNLTTSWDRGLSATDNITNRSDSLLFSVPAPQEDCSSVQLYCDGSGEQSYAYTAEGYYRYSNPPIGEHDITATITDAAGNVSSASAALTVTVETTPPTLDVWSLNMNTQTMELSFSEPIYLISTFQDRFTLQNNAAGDKTRTLSGTYAAGAYGSLLPGQYAMGAGADINKLRIRLSIADFNAVVDYAGGGLCDSPATSWLKLSAGAVGDVPGNSIAAVTQAVSGYTADTVSAANFRIACGAATNITRTAAETISAVITAYDSTGYRDPAYVGAKSLTFSGSTASLDGNEPTVDGINFGAATPITFSNGVGAGTIILYSSTAGLPDAQIEASEGSVSTIAPFLSVQVGPAEAVKVAFSQQPSSAGMINTPLAQQPKVQIQDTYGNKATANTEDITLYPSSEPDYFASIPGAILADNTAPITNGEASFSTLRYNKTGAIYLYANRYPTTLGVGAYSAGVAISLANTSAIEPASSPITDFPLIPVNDSPTEKFAVLRFAIRDAGEDSLPTRIDQIRIAIGGNGGNASTDIVWAGLYDGTGEPEPPVIPIATATGSAITNSDITFGTAPNADNAGGLSEVSNENTKEYTVKIYMKNSKLTAVDKQVYTFGIDEGLMGIDSGLSSRMRESSSSVPTVTGTIIVNATHLELVNQVTGNLSCDIKAGPPPASPGVNDLQVRATDSNRNIDKDISGIRSLTFYGLNSIGTTYVPNIKGTDFESSIDIFFLPSPGGVSVDNAVTLTAYKRELGNVYAKETSPTGIQNHFDCAVNVSAADAASIELAAEANGNNQTALITKQLPNPFIVTTKDQYTNPTTGTQVSFSVSGYPAGATNHGSLSLTSSSTDNDGHASTYLTLGNLAGQYSVQAGAAGAATPVTFTANATAPTGLIHISGYSPQQSGSVGQALAGPFVVRLQDSGGAGISGETVNFEILSSPAGCAVAPALSTSSAVTDDQAQAQTILTLGDKAGDYVVRAKYQLISGSYLTADFTATAVTAPPYKVVLSGPASVNAGAASGQFTISVRDQYDNASPVSQDTVFNLSTTKPLTGNFYSDAECAQVIAGHQRTVPNGASSAFFYYKDTATGNATITSAWLSGQVLDTAHKTSSTVLNIVPDNLHHLVITGAGALMATGDPMAVTITAYDANNNVVTNCPQLDVIFSGANPSPAPSNSPPTWNGNLFGVSAPLTFTNGVAVVTFIPYKAEIANINVASGPITASDALAITVRHGAADHLKFRTDLPASQTAGSEFNFETNLDVVDLYNNICDAANGATPYTDSKTITWTLASAHDTGPESGTDIFTNPVSFTDGSSTTSLKATLYFAETTSITAKIAALTGVDIASNDITVKPAAINKMVFSQWPLPPATTNVPFVPQPKVSVSDQFGNPCSNIAAQVTLSASLTAGSYTAANGVLSSPGGLTVNTANGVATFDAVKYSYPENIYLRAQANIQGYAVDPAYSLGIAPATAGDLTVQAVAAADTIPSTANSTADKVNVFAFKVTDAGTDGYGGAITKLVINRDTATDTITDWTNYIGTAYLSDGAMQILGAVTADTITFGDGATAISTVPNNSSRTYTLSLTLKAALPAGADNLVFGFSMDANSDIALGLPATSTLSAGAVTLTDSVSLTVTATKLKVTGSGLETSLDTNAGEELIIVIKAMDVNDNIDKDYDYSFGKDIIFSGAGVSDLGDNPTCTNLVQNDIAFGQSTSIKFTSGVSSSEIRMKLYKVQTAFISAADDSSPALAASGPDLLRIIVHGGAASNLIWVTQPVDKVVANAPWKEFVIAVSDKYGNIASSNTDVTITPSSVSGTVTKGLNAVDTVTASSGLASFSNFSVICSSYPGYVTLVASGPAGSGVSSSAASNEVTVGEKYNITFSVKDSVNAGAMSGFVFSAADAASGASVIPDATKNSPFDINGVLGYGTYNFKFTRDLYVDQISEKTLDTTADGADGSYDNKIAMTIYMMTIAESTADYRVMPSFIYDEYNESLAIRLWLEKRGKVIFNTDVNKLGSGVSTATVEVLYDEASNEWLGPVQLTAPGPEDYTNSAYTRTVNNLLSAANAFSKPLVPGKTYFARCKIYYGGPDGNNTLYEAGANFTVTIMQKLNQEIINKIGVAEGETLAGKIAAAQSAIESKVEAARVSIEQAATNIMGDTAKILTATEQTLPAQIKETIEPSLKSEILNRESTVRLGQTLTIRYRTYPGLSPTIDVYTPRNEHVLSQDTQDVYSGAQLIRNKNIMAESEDSPGIYSYILKLENNWGIGDYTIVCSEATRGTTDALLISAIRTDLEDVSGQVSTILGTTTGLSNLKDVADTLNSQFSIIESALMKINTDVVNRPKSATSSSDMDAVYRQLVGISKELNSIGTSQKVNLSKLYNVTKEKRGDLMYLKNKTQELKAAMDINQKMIDNMANRPVTQTWFEYK